MSPAPTRKTVVYPDRYLVLREEGQPKGPLTIAEAKELIGWTEEPADLSAAAKWSDYDIKDMNGRKVRLHNNPTNRPFQMPLALKYMNEMLRGKWASNMETIVFDKYGMVAQGQHRLVGFILSEQERLVDPGKWGNKEMTLSVAMGFGVESSPDVADTYDLGKGRSLADVIYRRHKFPGEDSDNKRMSKELAGAVRLVWLRVGGRQVSFAPHFPHSEAIEFLNYHNGIINTVKEIEKLNVSEDEKNRIANLISIPYAAGLCYLMANAPDSSMEKALEFWAKFASGAELAKGDPILVLRKMLTGMNAGSGQERDMIISNVIKAWHAWVKGESVKPADLQVKRRKEGDKMVVAEFPQLGGIDSTPPERIVLDRAQKRVMVTLDNRELTYKQLYEKGDGLQAGQVAKAVLKVNSKGQENPLSLEARGLVSVRREEPTEGKKPITLFKLTADGLKLLRGKK